MTQLSINVMSNIFSILNVKDKINLIKCNKYLNLCSHNGTSWKNVKCLNVREKLTCRVTRGKYESDTPINLDGLSYIIPLCKNINEITFQDNIIPPDIYNNFIEYELNFKILKKLTYIQQSRDTPDYLIKEILDIFGSRLKELRIIVHANQTKTARFRNISKCVNIRYLYIYGTSNFIKPSLSNLVKLKEIYYDNKSKTVPKPLKLDILPSVKKLSVPDSLLIPKDNNLTSVTIIRVYRMNEIHYISDVINRSQTITNVTFLKIAPQILSQLLLTLDKQRHVTLYISCIFGLRVLETCQILKDYLRFDGHNFRMINQSTMVLDNLTLLII